MSKYDKEREAMGIAPVASYSSSNKVGKSKYDDERNMYRRGDENKQYADAMKSAFQSNPESFLDPVPSETPIQDKVASGASAVAGAPVIKQILQGLGWAVDKVENAPGIKQLGGALAGGYNAIAENPSAAFSDWNSQAKKNISDLVTSSSTDSLSKSIDSIMAGARNPEESRAKRAEIIEGRTQGLGPVSKFSYDLLTQVASDPLSLLPFGGVSRTSKLANGSGKLMDAIPKGATVRPFVPPVEEVASRTLELPTGRGEMRYNNAINRSNLDPNLNPIVGQGDVHTFELPEGNYVAPTRMKINKPEDNFQSTYEKLLPIAVERMTPPLENANELAKWVHGHLNNAGHNVSLNDVRGLNYEDLRQLSEEMRTKLNPADVVRKTAHDMGYGKIYDMTTPSIKERLAQDAQKQVYGINPSKVNIARPDSFNVSKTSPAAAPESRIGFERKNAVESKKTSPSPSNSKYAAEREQILKETSEPTIQPDNAMDDVVQHAEPRIRDKVVNYLDDAEEAAKARLKAKRNTLSSNPIDQYADYAIIAAAKIGKGVVKVADLSEQLIREYGEHLRPHLKEIIKRGKEMYKQAEKQTEKEMQGLKDIDPTKLKDFSGFKYNTSDIYRNFKDVFGEKYPQVKAAILDPLDNAKLANVKMQEEWLNKLHTEVVEKLGIDKGSKLSALVQRFGEKQIDLDKLKELAPKDWEKVVEADKFFRKSYDTLIDQVNGVRAKIYPNNPDKIVPKREDYYRHFQEFSGLTGLKNLFDSPSQIDPNLVGISEFVTPKSKFAGFMQKRGLGPFKNDAVGGFLEYLPSASYATHIDPQIDVFKRLGKNLADETVNTKNINGFIEFLQKYSQDLAGKTNSLDRAFQEYVPGGRKTMGVINWVNQRVKANTILGNLGSAVSQIANVPTGIAFGKQHAMKGAGEAIKSALKGNPNYEKSQFLKERFLGKHYRKFDTKWLSLSNPLRLKSTAGWLLETADRMGSEFIWNTAYTKAVKEGIANPVKYADDQTRRLVAGRGIGEVPLMQKSKLFQTVAPFTLEVANLWRIQKDFIKEKDFAGLAMLMASSYVFNKLAEEVKGSGVVFDPIQAIVEASEDGLSPMERGGRLAGEIVSNIPLGGTLANLYPEYGGELGGMKFPTRKKLFGDNDPTRFGSGIIALKGAQDPLYKLLPGFGGNQIKKTIEGAKSLSSGGSYKDGELKYQIGDNQLKAAQSLTFGPNATREAQTYFDKERRPLTVEETKAVNESSDPKAAYEALQKRKRVDTIRASMTKVRNDKEKDAKQKEKELIELNKKLQKALN